MPKIEQILARNGKQIMFLLFGITTLIIVVKLLVKSKGKKAVLSIKDEIKLTEANQELAETTAKTDIEDITSLRPDYFVNRPKATRLNDLAVEIKSNDLYSAMRGFGTNEEEIYGVLESLTYKTQLSQIAWQYADTYKKSLRKDFMSELSDTELAEIVRIINKLG